MSPTQLSKMSKDDFLLAASSNDNSVRFWDLNPDNIYDLPTIILDHKGWVWDASFHPDGGYLVTAAEDGLLRRFPLKPLFVFCILLLFPNLILEYQNATKYKKD